MYTPAPGTRPIRRHHTAHYYRHRIHESLSTRISKILCAIFLILLSIAGIVTFILWLSLRPHRPRFHIHEFSLLGLAQETGFENAHIEFNVTVRNPTQHIGIHYDSMDGGVYYKDQKIGSSPLLDPFYQEAKNTTVVHAVLTGATLTVNSERWMEFMRDRAKGMVRFRLEILSTIRFRVFAWDTKRDRMHANCIIDVGPDGLILPTSKGRRCPVYFT